MTKQILKEKIPIENLINLYKHIYKNYNNTYIIINEFFFKKINYENLFDSFISNIEPYYFKSKKEYYLNKKHNYNSFLTIIRHICKSNNIAYTSQINYDKSKYYINYYILLDINK